MNLQKEDIFPVLWEMEKIFEIFKQTLFLDQWLRETTHLSFIMIASEQTGKIWHYRNGVKVNI